MKVDLNTIVEKFNSLEVPARFGIFGAVLGVLFLIDFFTVMGLQRMLLKNTTTRIEKLKADLERVSSDKQRIGQMQQGLANSKKDVDSVSGKIHLLSEMPTILEDISRVAGETGFKLDQLTPLRDKQEKLTEADGVVYYGLPVSLEARASFHTFGKFLNRLEGDNIYFSLKDVVMEPDVKSGNVVSIRAVLKVILVEKNESENK